MSSGFRIIRNPLLTVTLLVLLHSCVEEIKYPEEYFIDLMVVNSIIDPDSIARVNVSRSLHPSGQVEFVYIEDAQLDLSTRNNESQGFSYQDLGWYTNPAFPIQAGQEYSLQVNSSIYPSIRSTTVVPEKPEIRDVRKIGDSISFKIIDDGSQENYYFVTLYGWKESSESVQNEDGSYSYIRDTLFRRITTISAEEYIEAYFDGRYGWVNSLTGFTYDDEFWDVEPDFEAESYIFSDQLINGKIIDFSCKIDIWGSQFPDRSPAFEVRVHSMDINYYEYLISVAEYLTTDETPLIDRAIVYNNIIGGYGVFGSQNGVSLPISYENVLIQ